MIDFMECNMCRAKPGMPILCEACLHNRKLVADLNKEVEDLKNLVVQKMGHNAELAAQIQENHPSPDWISKAAQDIVEAWPKWAEQAEFKARDKNTPWLKEFFLASFVNNLLRKACES